MCLWILWVFCLAYLPSLICPLPSLLVSPPDTPFPTTIQCLTRYCHLQVLEDYPKGGGKNGYLRAPGSGIVDYDGPHKSGCPGEQSPGEGELMKLLAPFFNEKAMLLLESR